MLITHGGKAPLVHPEAWVAPDATLCGDVEIGPGCRVLHGARLIGEGGGTIRLGRECIVMENAVVRAGPQHPCRIGDNCLVGPNAHVVGATLERQVFVATGASRPVVVAVTPPSGALDGDVVDLIVTAASAAEPTISGQARIVAVIDDLLDREDEGHLVDTLQKELSDDKKSPGPALPLLGVALLALARRAKRS
mgnify:CR=1 FL=1